MDAITKALEIANAVAPINLTKDDIWITDGTGIYGEYQVRYHLEGIEGFFICRQPLKLTNEEWFEYEESRLN